MQVSVTVLLQAGLLRKVWMITDELENMEVNQMEQERTYTIETDESFGEVQISDEVVAIIAGLAATEVDGVASIAGNLTRELIAKLGKKNLSKSVVVEVADGHVNVRLTLYLQYGYSVPVVCSKVQERVKNAIENMTALEVDSVNVSIAGINL